MLAAVEHSSVREASARGGEVMLVDVDGFGRIDLTEVERALDTAARRGSPAALVHCQVANHEVGTIQPVREVGEACRRHDALAARRRVHERGTHRD